jgi:uncharacterized protein (DUF1810 family)
LAIPGFDVVLTGKRIDLTRFIKAQQRVYATALAELANGEKKSHWMWYIFPQLDGLARSATASYYAIKSREEAEQYLLHPLLGSRLEECAEVLLAVNGRAVADIFGFPDYLKLHSSMTLFASLSPADSLYRQVLEKYYSGSEDERTLQLLEML